MAYSTSVLILMVMVAFVSTSATESHFDTYTYYTTVTNLYCVQLYRQACSRFLFWKKCSTNYWMDCSTVYNTELRLGQKCQTGWTSTDCNIPICSPACNGGKVCTAPNTCSCITTTDGCSSVPCSADNNCYPGSCVGGNCNCPAGFSGPNCQTIDKTPDISACKIQLYDSSPALVKEIACEPAMTEPQTTTWISTSTPGQVQAKWTSNYVQPFSLPDRTYAPHVQNSPVPIGVSETGFTVSVQGTPPSASSSKLCTEASPDSPENTVNCDVPKQWSDYGITPAHNQTIRVDVSSKLGGHKDGANSASYPGSNFQKQYFTGAPITRSALIKFDLLPPVHCLSNPNNDCILFAIYLEPDITTNPTIEAKFNNWTDDGSGISNFHVEVFFMQPGADNVLVNSGEALAKTNITPSVNNFIFACKTSGVYSIELTVQDQAGNSAKARKLFIFTKDSMLKTDTNKPVYIMEANPDSGYKYITKFDDPQNGGNIPLNLVWTGHFSSNAKFDSAWGLPAQPWNVPKAIDDSYKDIYGRRSIYSIDNMPGGIISYGVAYIVDDKNGGRGFVPQNWTYLNATKETYPLPITSLTDGSTIVAWVQCTDVAGGSITEQIVVGVDRTPPSVQAPTYFKANEVDESTSRMSIKTFDTASGIRQISFGIYDSKIKNLVYSGSSGPQKRDPSTGAGRRRKRIVPPCKVNDTTCYCIPSGDCYNYIQTVDIDNCWLDRLPGHSFEFRFTVTNGANLTSSEQTEALGELTLQCRRYQPPIAGIVIGCVLGFLVLVALIIVIVLLVRVYVFKKPMPRRITSAQQTIRNKFSRPQLDENIAYTSADDLHPNNNQKAAAKPNKWKPAPNASKAEETYVYSSRDGYDNNRSSSAAEAYSSADALIIVSKQLRFGEKIAEGRFAVVKKAQLTQGNETIPVATKGLKRGYSDADADLMNNKIGYQSRIPSHVNVVKFLGQLEESSETGPMMVLEYCEMPLKDWLSKIGKINSDVLEDMSIFTMNIANGVKHLHENQVIHRRLGARNVLLKQHHGGLIAKLIGFGPNREDRDGEQASLPIKWLAPETLETLKSGSPTYDKNSDAWSFGITVWEIYSKGQLPFGDMSSEKVKKLLTKDKRMTLTRPEACPVDLFQSALEPCWNFKAARRPNFAQICSDIDSFRKGTGQEPPNYYTLKSPYSGIDGEPAEYELYDDAA